MSDGAKRDFAHLFDGHAATYAAFRPTYPAALFDWLVAQVPGRAQAWDVGTGNGQVAVALATRFAAVLATDPSATQLAAATAHPQVTYRRTTYDSGLPDASVDLVTVGQALHWFDIPAFFTELRRVMRPGALFAAFAYVHSSVTPALDAVTRHYHDVTVWAHWAPEHHIIREGYRTLDLPIRELSAPRFEIRASMTLAQYAGFFRSWSSTQRLLQADGAPLVQSFEAALAEAWGDAERRDVVWPMILRAGTLR